MSPTLCLCTLALSPILYERDLHCLAAHLADPTLPPGPPAHNGFMQTIPQTVLLDRPCRPLTHSKTEDSPQQSLHPGLTAHTPCAAPRPPSLTHSLGVLLRRQEPRPRPGPGRRHPGVHEDVTHRCPDRTCQQASTSHGQSQPCTLAGVLTSGIQPWLHRCYRS